MVEEPDRLRSDIEYTRASLTRDVDALTEKTSPKKVAQRRWMSVKEKVMGSTAQAQHAASGTAGTVRDKASSAASTVEDKASSAVGAVQEKAGDAAGALRAAPHAVVQQAQGNPVAAGIIAFGVGLLAATLIPVSDVERRAGQQLKDNSGELTDRVKEAASEVKDDLAAEVREAAGEVKQTAREAAQNTKDQAASSAKDATQRTKQAAQSAS